MWLCMAKIRGDGFQPSHSLHQVRNWNWNPKRERGKCRATFPRLRFGFRFCWQRSDRSTAKAGSRHHVNGNVAKTQHGSLVLISRNEQHPNRYVRALVSVQPESGRSRLTFFNFFDRQSLTPTIPGIGFKRSRNGFRLKGMRNLFPPSCIARPSFILLDTGIVQDRPHPSGPASPNYLSRKARPMFWVPFRRRKK